MGQKVAREAQSAATALKGIPKNRAIQDLHNSFALMLSLVIFQKSMQILVQATAWGPLYTLLAGHR